MSFLHKAYVSLIIFALTLSGLSLLIIQPTAAFVGSTAWELPLASVASTHMPFALYKGGGGHGSGGHSSGHSSGSHSSTSEGHSSSSSTHTSTEEESNSSSSNRSWWSFHTYNHNTCKTITDEQGNQQHTCQDDSGSIIFIVFLIVALSGGLAYVIWRAYRQHHS